MLTLIKGYFKTELLPLLANLRLAIALLLTIAIFSIAGTVIEQGESLAFYQANYPEEPALFGFLTWKVILISGLDHVYRTWWFLALLILFGASLTACTFTRQFPALRAARRWKYYKRPRQFQKLTLSAEIPKQTLDVVGPLLEEKRYKVFQDGKTLYARKGIAGRIGPIAVHGSMLIILLGAIWGAMTGFFAQEIVPSGETFAVRHIFDAGPWAESQIPKDWTVRVNRFWIDYTLEGAIDQFYSDLSVLDDSGEEIKRETIHVNKPLKHRGVTLYQADWGIAAVRVKFNKSPVLEIPMSKLDAPQGGRYWGTWLPTKPDMSEGVTLIAQDLQGTLLVYDRDGRLVATVREGMTVDLDNVTLSLVEVVGSTGLQIKADPGVPIVYAGFALLMAGVVMSYVSHSQIWALEHNGTLYFGGRTNRAQVLFERELLGLLERLETAPPAERAHPETLSLV